MVKTVEYEDQTFLLMGFSKGNFCIEDLANIIDSGKLNPDFIYSSSFLTSPVSCMELLDVFGSRIGIGTEGGEFLLYDFLKREEYLA
eukprot:CAMPEP_0170511988 /NCGR_PEP_ID=MMETSP0208-20121228/66606_1 /TAXON_ID=197538 /ORGANISM="Strombidium inclinatum, Strain S3" /LENGTH=86 /DNA_ID=CAMNT_0010795577 /DNA_START=37 /DNA_END=297 /DNA_ORIENTATION=+